MSEKDVMRRGLKGERRVLSEGSSSAGLTWLNALIASLYVTRAYAPAPPLPPAARADITAGRGGGAGEASRVSGAACNGRVTET